ncbi:MAG TPA: D-alanyl-D-alanine carboxypeptidase/D-alanyl-D-alanine-endopeptidase [Solirubrobacter sp.]|nr:D-alanyl-D-alanine carboxypeptidase/D-alanyl-D-alanine-endopeptidase [Solirubrobacter sp.]
MIRVTALVAFLVLLLAPAADAAGLAGTKRALARQMARAGGSSGAYVVDVDTGQVLYSKRSGVGRMPASVEKLYTSSTALLLYGAEGRLTTEVLASALPDEQGTIAGDLVLRGGGDPTFGSAATSALAEQLVDGGLVRLQGRVIGDESAFDAFRGVPSSRYALTSDVGPLSALAFNHGRSGRRRPYWQRSPAWFAADQFTKALRKAGVKVTRRPRARRAPTGMTPLADWSSPPMSTVVRWMNQPSDNFIAETLIKGLGAAFGELGSTAAGSAVVRSTVRRFGVRPRVVDGSGLSRSDRTSPRQVVKLLTGMDASEVAEEFDASLAVVGRNGTLYRRMRGTAAQDRCHAKTGTLHDVSTLAGFCISVGGQRVAFAFLMNRVWPPSAHVLQDRMTVALARYRG